MIKRKNYLIGFSILDCQGLVCLYDGIVNLDSCQCQCKSFTSGKQCENLNCSLLSDTCDYGNDKSLCITYSNVPNECPKFCGLCDRFNEIKNYYNSNEFLTNLAIQTIKNTQLVSSIGHLSISLVFAQLIIISFILFLIQE